MFFSSVIIPILSAAQEWRQGWIAFRCGIEWLFGEEEKNINRKLSPLVGESVNRQVDERGKYEQKGKKVSYKTLVNTCPVILERSEESGKGYKI